MFIILLQIHNDLMKQGNIGLEEQTSFEGAEGLLYSQESKLFNFRFDSYP